MGSDEREAILVIADLLEGDLPTPYRVAAFTVGAELAAMYVGMAVGAMGTYVLEDQTGMALGTGDFLVHAAQWVAGVVMIEFRIRADRLPTCVAVALLAGDGDGAMGISHLGLGSAHRGATGVRRLLRAGSKQR